MFRFIFQTIILLYVILLIYSIIDIQKYNINGILKDIDNYEDIEEELKNLNPIMVHYEHNFSPNNLPCFAPLGYFDLYVNSLSLFC